MKRGDLVRTADGYQGIVVRINNDFAVVFTGNGLNQPYPLDELTPIPFIKGGGTANFVEILRSERDQERKNQILGT